MKKNLLFKVLSVYLVLATFYQVSANEWYTWKSPEYATVWEALSTERWNDMVNSIWYLYEKVISLEPTYITECNDENVWKINELWKTCMKDSAYDVVFDEPLALAPDNSNKSPISYNIPDYQIVCDYFSGSLPGTEWYPLFSFTGSVTSSNYTSNIIHLSYSESFNISSSFLAPWTTIDTITCNKAAKYYFG